MIPIPYPVTGHIRYSVKNQIGTVLLSNHQNSRLVRNFMNRINDTVKEVLNPIESGGYPEFQLQETSCVL